MRKTKIVCTIGPACDSEETLRAMMLAGMNVARLNFSHGTHAEHQVRIDRIKKLRAELDLPIAIMLDTKGPEYRIGTFENGKIELHSGDTFTFTTEAVTGNAERVSVSYAGLAQDLEPGDTVLVNDGLIALTVTATTGTDVVCRVTAGGVLSDRKSMSFPNKVLKQTFLSEQDKRDLLFGIENDVDFVAASFVSRRQDLVDLNGFLRAHGGGDISVIAKIENQPGIDNIEDIFTECTGIMIARGDMGVEVPYEELPSIQKELIGKCRLLGKRVITATEMLESMTHNIRPTRAEIADVANAVYDGTSAIMLSGETAAGEHPVEALSAMARIAEYTEAHINYAKRFPKTQFEIHDTLDAISHATCGMAIDIGAKVITVCSITGRTARLISRFRGPTDIIGLTTNERAYRKLALSWGITPIMSEVYESTDVLFYHALQVSRKVMQLEKGDKVIITGGIINGRSGKCSENCKYCAQSAHYSTAVEEYPLLNDEALLAGARYNDERGILRYSIVTSGKRLTDEDVDRLCASYRHIAEHCGISLCASHGLISKKHCEQLKAAGVSRYHNNLETSRRNFPNVCTTHTYDDKLQTIKWALEAGLEVCSGGIMGLGETMEDRIDMYMDIAALGIKSMPVNFLTPIPGTPYADMTPLGEEEQLRIVALVRFIMPDGFVRIAAGRNTMKDHGRKIFMSGANAAISGDMLTTAGVTIREDLAMLAELGYEVRMK